MAKFILGFILRLSGGLISRVRCCFWSRLLDTHVASLGALCQIIGRRRMQVGSGFRAGRLLWLEAVESYGAQNFTPRLSIGERVSCSDAVHISCAFELHIGNDVLMGSKVHVTDHNHGLYQGAGQQSSPQ